MRKSKILKALLVLGMSVATATSMIGFAACGDNSEPEGGNNSGIVNGGNENQGGNQGGSENEGGNQGGNENEGGETEQAVAHTYSYNYEAIDPQGDTSAITSFVRDNAFMTIVDVDAERVKYRTSNSCFEITNSAVSVTFVGTGTLKIKFASTNGSNTSAFALLNSDGDIVEATAKDTSVSVVIEDTTIDEDGDYVNLEGLYTVTGTTAAELTYTITEAGTYTFYSRWCYLDGTTAKSRGCRITGVEMVDNYKESDAPAHTHVYSEEYLYDEDYHWHEALCVHTDLVSGKGAHDTDGEGGVCSVCGYNPNAAVTVVDFRTMTSSVDDNNTALTVNATYDTTWLKVTTVGSGKLKYSLNTDGTIKEQGVSLSETVLTITVTEESVLTINYYSTSNGRGFTLRDSDSQPVGAGTEGYTYTSSSQEYTVTQAAGVYHAVKFANKTPVLTLQAGTYTITFDATEHKVASISLVPTAE